MTIDELEVQKDWRHLIGVVSKNINIPELDVIKDLPIHCVDELEEYGVESVAEIHVDLAGNNTQVSLNIGEVFFELKAPIAVMCLIHEMCHAILVIRYLQDLDFEGLKKYYETNGGHTTEWNELAKTIKQFFPKIPPIVVNLNLQDESIYEG